MVFNFPATKFVRLNSIPEQAFHVLSEAKEINDSLTGSDIKHTAREALDCIHSCETLLRKIQIKHPNINLQELRRDVERGNFERQYYELEIPPNH